MVSLVGYTGFVGSNLAESFAFDGLYNSKNIEQAYGTCPDILYYSGVPAQKFLANKFPMEDLKTIEKAIYNIKAINPKKIVLISTIDVYKQPNQKDENSPMEIQGLHAYGLNRLKLEQFVKDNFDDYLILRLPGLYGKNLKKNFIYDYIKFIPSMLTKEKLEQLCTKSSELLDYYTDARNGFYKLNENINEQKLKELFYKIGFSALNFTDSRGVFQFYNLEYLYKDIQIAIKNNVKILNIATQPVTIGEIYRTLTGKEFINEIGDNPPFYDFRTIHWQLYGSQNGYIQSKEFVLNNIKIYVENFLKSQGEI